MLIKHLFGILPSINRSDKQGIAKTGTSHYQPHEKNAIYLFPSYGPSKDVTSGFVLLETLKPLKYSFSAQK